MAYDTIMVFEDHFKNHILPDQIHILNVSFFTPEMRRNFGGCAGNIAYTLKLLGGDPLVMATVGEDFALYRNWLEQNDIRLDHITLVEDSFTAQAFITTDIDNNQITAFHPGAMNFAHQNKVQDVTNLSDYQLGIVSPDGRDAMLHHAQQFVDAGIPFLFDPGQGLPMFNGDELIKFCDQASYLIVNDYESQMMMEKTGKSLQELANRVDAMIVTRGSRGSQIIEAGQQIDIPAVNVTNAVDPTGCGDAYRAGLMFAMMKGVDWRTAGQVAALCGAIKVEQSGTQNHQFTVQEFAQRYQSSFGEVLTLS